MSSTSTLRQALSQLQHYTSNSNDNGNGNGTSQVINNEEFQKLKVRYLNARKAYLKHRITELVAVHLSEENSDDYLHAVAVVAESSNKEGYVKQVKLIQQAVDDVVVKYEALSNRYATICADANELEKMIIDLEQQKQSSQEDSNANDDDDDDTNQNDGDNMEEQDLAIVQHELEEQWQNLSARKMERQRQIQRLKTQISKVDAERVAVTDKLNHIVRAHSHSDGGGESNAENVNTTEIDVASFSNVQLQIDEVRDKISNLRDMAEWYDTVRVTLEALSAMSIQKVVRLEQQDSHDNIRTAALEVQVRLQLDEGIHYLLGVELCAAPMDSKNGNHTLRVSGARVIGSNIMKSKDGAVQCTALSTHSLAEMVEASRSLVSSNNPCRQQKTRQGGNRGNGVSSCDDLKFVLRESLARLRGANQRLQHLELLRKKYLTQIEYTKCKDINTVICSLDDGVTVVLTLTPDCPLLPGSAFIEQIAGLGGWEQSVLSGIQRKVNDFRFKSALDVMNAVAKEIKRTSLAKPLDVSMSDMIVEINANDDDGKH